MSLHGTYQNEELLPGKGNNTNLLLKTRAAFSETVDSARCVQGFVHNFPPQRHKLKLTPKQVIPLFVKYGHITPSFYLFPHVSTSSSFLFSISITQVLFCPLIPTQSHSPVYYLTHQFHKHFILPHKTCFNSVMLDQSHENSHVLKGGHFYMQIFSPKYPWMTKFSFLYRPTTSYM